MKRTCTVRGKILLNAFTNWIKPDDKVLDIGCGNGEIAKIIKGKYHCHIEGTDIMNFLSYKIPFKLMKSPSELPYDENSFDVAMLNDVLHHTRNQKEILNEALRISKKLLIFETRPTLIAKILDHVLNWGHNINMPIPLTHKSPEDWSKIFKEIGLQYELQEAESGFFYPISHFAFKIIK